MKKIIKAIQKYFWVIFVQIFLNTVYLCFIACKVNSKLLYIVFLVSVIIQILGITVLSYLAFTKSPIFNIDRSVTNNKFVVIPEQGVEELKKNNK
jgi:hypothetical protein